MILDPLNNTQEQTIPEVSEVKTSSGVEVKTNSASGIDSNSASTIRLSQDSSKKRTVNFQQQLQKTYCFREESAKDICAFAEALGKNLDEINIQPNFRMKVRSLVAKIFSFFGNTTRAKKLQQDSQKLFEEFKNEIIKNPNLPKCLSAGQNYESKLRGLYWILAPELMSLADGDMEKIPGLINNNTTAKQIFEKNILSVTTEQFQESLETNLVRGDSKSKFNQYCPICEDLDRGYAIIFRIGDKEISINPSHEKKGVNSFETLQEQLKTLCEEDAEQIRNFCQIFSSQGVFANAHPYGLDMIHAEGNACPTIEVTFSNDKVSVNVKSEGLSSKEYLLEGHLIPIPTETKCEFSFDYNIENGIGSNVQIHKFKQTFSEEQ